MQFTFDAEPGSSNVTLDEITPKDLSVLRELLNGTAIDAMMYLTPRHQAAVLRFVRSEMNRVRNKFGAASARTACREQSTVTPDARICSESAGARVAF